MFDVHDMNNWENKLMALLLHDMQNCKYSRFMIISIKCS